MKKEQLVVNNSAQVEVKKISVMGDSKNQKRENTLRNIMAAAAGAFDTKKIINAIVNEIGELFNADRCFIVEFNPEMDSCNPIQDFAQYLSSEKIKSHLPYQPTKGELSQFFRAGEKKTNSVC